MEENYLDTKSNAKKQKKSILKNKQVLSNEGKEIIGEIEKIKMKLEETRSNFDLATNEILIDCYIYEIISLNKKYQYFLQLAKKNGLVAKGFEKIG